MFMSSPTLVTVPCTPCLDSDTYWRNDFKSCVHCKQTNFTPRPRIPKGTPFSGYSTPYPTLLIFLKILCVCPWNWGPVFLGCSAPVWPQHMGTPASWDRGAAGCSGGSPGSPRVPAQGEHRTGHGLWVPQQPASWLHRSPFLETTRAT